MSTMPSSNMIIPAKNRQPNAELMRGSLARLFIGFTVSSCPVPIITLIG